MGVRFDQLKQWLSHPLNLLLGMVASVASILSVFLFFSSLESRDLVFLIHPVKAYVVKSGQASSLRITFEGKELTNDVTAVQIAFWNAGKKAIKKSEILEPVTITTGIDHPIIETSLQKITRQLTHIALNRDRLDKGEAILTWDILERLDGGVVQIIYAGNNSIPIEVNGTIEGQGSVRKHILPVKIRTPEEQYAAASKPDRIYIGLTIIMIGLVIFMMYSDRKDKSWIPFILGSFMIIDLLFLLVHKLWQFRQVTLPFSF